MKRISYTCLAVFLAISLFFSLGNHGVFAYWLYYGAAPQTLTLNLLTAVAPWEGSEVLPNDTMHGKNHVALIEAVLNGEYVSGGEKVNLGLNKGSDSYLNQKIKDRQDYFWRDATYLGSMDFWQEDNISDYFAINEATNNLSFVLDFPKKNATEQICYLYTTSVDLGASRNPKIPIGTDVYPVFRTTLLKNAEGVWEATITEIGYAASEYYSNPLLGLAWEPSFDYDNWNAGELGTSTSNAIYANTGLNLEVNAKDEETPVYYTITKTSQTDVKITVASDDTATVKVYDQSMKLVSVRAGSQGSKTITFRAAKNTKYYIEVIGDTVSTVTVA
ncbi:MAG: hypothetical protein E7342_03945 [Clostridiales bacterium]|nr:hypothetical protein [Clostridiales bacterium]